MNDKDLLDEVIAGEEFVKRGYKKKICPKCEGTGQKTLAYPIGTIPCYHCDQKGYIWEAPITK